MGKPSKRRGLTGVAKYALVCGLAAVAVSFIPLASDFLTIPLGLVAITLGCAEIWRSERGRPASVVPATFGTVFGAVALFVGAMMFISTQNTL